METFISKSHLTSGVRKGNDCEGYFISGSEGVISCSLEVNIAQLRVVGVGVVSGCIAGGSVKGGGGKSTTAAVSVGMP